MIETVLNKIPLIKVAEFCKIMEIEISINDGKILYEVINKNDSN